MGLNCVCLGWNNMTAWSLKRMRKLLAIIGVIRLGRLNAGSITFRVVTTLNHLYGSLPGMAIRSLVTPFAAIAWELAGLTLWESGVPGVSADWVKLCSSIPLASFTN